MAGLWFAGWGYALVLGVRDLRSWGRRRRAAHLARAGAVS
jgi:hypothetical protein